MPLILSAHQPPHIAETDRVRETAEQELPFVSPVAFLLSAFLSLQQVLFAVVHDDRHVVRYKTVQFRHLH